MSDALPDENRVAHTPGPWSCAQVWRGPETKVHAEVDGRRVALAEVFTMYSAGEKEANARLIAAVPDMHAILDELEGSFDEQTYQDKAREDFDAPDNREYSVNITAKQLRAISRALSVAEGRSHG